MKKLVFGFLLLFPLSVFADTNCNILRPDQVNGGPIQYDKLSVDGYVISVSDCPACPAGAVCEACVAPHFIISSSLQTQVSDKIALDTLILFPAAPGYSPAAFNKQLTKGKLYRFKLATDRDASWKFTGKYQDSFNRHLRATSFLINPIPCKER